MASNRSRLIDLLDEFSPKIRDAFLAAIDDITDNVNIGLLIERLEARDIDGALRALNLDPEVYRILDIQVAAAFEAGGQATVGALPTLRDADGNRLVIRFDGRNVAAENWLKTHSSQAVTGIMADQREAIRSALTAGMTRGENPRTTALDIVGRINPKSGKREGGIVGLTSQQQSYVEAYRAELFSGDPALMRNALKRARRDKRFDSTVLKAIEAEAKIPADKARLMVQRYADRMLKLRGDTIGRTEAMASLHAAQDEALRQTMAKGNLEASQVLRIWRTASDSRVRHSHVAMEGQKVAINGVFKTPSGAVLRYPGDPLAPAGEIINCRCTLELAIDFYKGLR